MTLPLTTLEQLTKLACIECQDEAQALAQEVSNILDFAEQLKDVNTDNVTPLFHPLNIFQQLREDTAQENSVLPQLEALAPQFEDGFYLVPQVIGEEE